MPVLPRAHGLRLFGWTGFLLAISLGGQQPPPTIRVPVRLVSVPTLVVSKDGKYVPGLTVADFQLTDDRRPRQIKLDTEALPISIALAVQITQDVREYLPFIELVGSLAENSLAAENGESALVTYNEDVSIAKPFGSGDLQKSLKALVTSGHSACSIDAGVRAVQLLESRIAPRSRVLLFVGQPIESGSKATIEELAAQAEKANVQIYALTLPLLGRSFVSDSFRLGGFGSQWYKGGYQASIELTKAVPALKRAAQASESRDPFSLLTIATGGLQMHFHKQKQLENAIIAVGDALRSRYMLSFAPDPDAGGFHSIKVSVDVPGATVYARPGYGVETATPKPN